MNDTLPGVPPAPAPAPGPLPLPDMPPLHQPEIQPDAPVEIPDIDLPEIDLPPLAPGPDAV